MVSPPSGATIVRHSRRRNGLHAPASCVATHGGAAGEVRLALTAARSHGALMLGRVRPVALTPGDPLSKMMGVSASLTVNAHSLSWRGGRMRLAVRGLESAEVGALLQFHAEMYGAFTYQASPRYLSWLYEENPSSRGLSDCILALDQGRIVGCVHRMRLPCVTEDGTESLVSLQNHVVSPSLRAGAGLMLLQKAVRGEHISLSPGVSSRLREAYRRLDYHEMPSFWLMRILNPLSGAVQAALRTLSRGTWPGVRARLGVRLAKKARARGLRVTFEPDHAQLERLAQQLVSQAREQDGPHVPWTAELVRWRFFAPNGPRHLLVEKPMTREWAVLSFGIKSRLTVVRLLEHECRDRGFLKEVLRVARKLGASVALAYTTRASVRDELLGLGFRSRDDAPSSFTNGTDRLSVGAAATDVGFEALLTELA
jgi:hypothetical protein